MATEMTPEVRAKLSESMKASWRKRQKKAKKMGRPAGFKVSKATRKKLAAAMRRRYAAHATANGNSHQTVNGAIDAPRKKTVRAEMVELARLGAVQRLRDIEREAEKLRIFLANSQG